MVLMIALVCGTHWRQNHGMLHLSALWLSGGESEEPDNIRRMLTETSPWLLLVTFLVTILHTLFDILAFRSDVMFWRSRKNMEGLSAKFVLAYLHLHPSNRLLEIIELNSATVALRVQCFEGFLLAKRAWFTDSLVPKLFQEFEGNVSDQVSFFHAN